MILQERSLKSQVHEFKFYTHRVTSHGNFIIIQILY